MQELDTRLSELFDVLDALHTAASQGQIAPLDKRELVGWLNEFVYTAQETIDEINKPVLRIVERPYAVGMASTRKEQQRERSIK